MRQELRDRFNQKYPQGITAMKFIGGEWVEVDVTKEILDLIDLHKDLSGYISKGSTDDWHSGWDSAIKQVQKDMNDILIDSTCGKCGEREETELCPKCGAESYGNCPCKPKEEKIKEPNYPIGYIGGESKNLITTADFKRWIVQVTNKLNKVSE